MLKRISILGFVTLALLLFACHDGSSTKAGTDDYSPTATKLAENFAPILYLVKQTPTCDDTFDTDPYRPTSVDAFFNKSNVQMLSGSKVAKARPLPTDLAGMGSSNNFDIYTPKPTHEDDRCAYEQGYTTGGSADTVYTRVVVRGNETAIQYWFFYYLNDWINVHEGDWEFVQLLFKGTPADIISNNITPQAVGFSQHTGGRSVAWVDVEKAPMNSGAPALHPVVYVGSGSHSNFMHAGFWHAEVKWWFDNCDLAVGPTDPRSQRMQLGDPLHPLQGDYTLTPLQDAGLNQNFAWRAFPGLWGQKSIFGFSGTKLPLVEQPGDDPWGWDGSITHGPNAEDFCATRPTNPRNIAADHRLLQDGIPTNLGDLQILAGDVVVFFVSWFGSDVTMTIDSPAGIVTQNDANVTVYDKQADYEVYRIENAPVGTWHLSVTGTGLPPGGEEVWWRVMDLPQACSAINPNDTTRDSDLDGVININDPSACVWDSQVSGQPDLCTVSPAACFLPPPIAGTPTFFPIGTPTPP